MSDEPSSGAITRLLARLDRGDEEAIDELYALVYDELRQLAERQLSRERAGHTLQPTALVHEVHLRLFKGDTPRPKNRAQFYRAASTAMRRVLIDWARMNGAAKRGGDRRRIGLCGEEIAAPRPKQLVDVHEALKELESVYPALVEVVELRFFGGFSVSETALALDCCTGTVDNRWAAAKKWLSGKLRSFDEE